MRLTDLLALSYVPRWAIVPMSRTQTVSDHTFRVMVIAREIIQGLVDSGHLPEPAFLGFASFFDRALCHDALEAYSGDIPSTFKHDIFDLDGVDYLRRIEDVKVPWASSVSHDWRLGVILNIADVVETYTWVRKYGQGPHAHMIKMALEARIEELLTVSDWVRACVKGVIRDIINETGRGQ